MADYRMTFDLHTHTILERSNGRRILHATGTVEENVAAAEGKGLYAVGISNHGPGHITYGMAEESIPAILGQIQEAKRLHPNIAVYFGVEANIINPSGALDVAEEDFSRFDYIMAGYHYGIFGEDAVRAAGIHGANWLYENIGALRRLAEKLSIGSKRENGVELLTRINTELMTQAVRTNRPKVLTHPGDKGPFDIRAVARACEETGTWMEINHYHRDLTIEGIRIASNYDVKFIIGSDAHAPENVGRFERALDRALQAGLDPRRIVNLEPVKIVSGARGAGPKAGRESDAAGQTDDEKRDDRGKRKDAPPAEQAKQQPQSKSGLEEFKEYMEYAEDHAKRDYQAKHGGAPIAGEAKEPPKPADKSRFEELKEFMSEAEERAKKDYQAKHGADGGRARRYPISPSCRSKDMRAVWRRRRG